MGFLTDTYTFLDPEIFRRRVSNVVQTAALLEAHVRAPPWGM
jgi:ABC-type iron transport system FetAB ATPase subunit